MSNTTLYGPYGEVIEPLQPLPPLSLDFLNEPLTREASLTDLRDYFAATALPGLLDLEITQVWNQSMGLKGKRDHALSVAKAAYLMADAMLKAREQPRFPNVSCSSCGQSFGPGNEGFSECADHAHLKATEA